MCSKCLISCYNTGLVLYICHLFYSALAQSRPFQSDPWPAISLSYPMPCIFYSLPYIFSSIWSSVPIHSISMPFVTSLYFKNVYFRIKIHSLYFHTYAILLYCFPANHVHSISTNVSYPSSCIFTEHMLNYARSAVFSFASIPLIYPNSGPFVPCFLVKFIFFLTAIPFRGVLFCICPTYIIYTLYPSICVSDGTWQP